MATRKRRFLISGHSIMALFRLTRGNVYAEIMVDRRGPYDVWMYVVQREGSSEIIAMGSCHTENEARAVASHALEQFASSPQKASA